MLKILFINLLLPTALISTPVIVASGIFVATDNNPIKVEEKIILEEPERFAKEKIDKNLSELKEKLEEDIKNSWEKFFSWFKASVAHPPASVDTVIIPVFLESAPAAPAPKDPGSVDDSSVASPSIYSDDSEDDTPPKLKEDVDKTKPDVQPNKKLEELHWTDLTEEGQDIVLGVYKDLNDYAPWWEHRITDNNGKWFQKEWDYFANRKWNWPESDGHKMILIPRTLGRKVLKLSHNTNSPYKPNKPDFATHQDQEWRFYFGIYYTSSNYEERLREGYSKQIQKKQPKPEIVKLDNLD